MGRRRIDPLALPTGDIVGFDQSVGQGVAFLVPTLDQHRTAMLADELERPGDRILLAAQAPGFGQVGRGDGRNIHQAAEGGDRRVIGKLGAAGRNHDRVEDDGHALHLREAVGYDFGGKGAADHADLHRIDADVGSHRIDLGENHFRRYRMDGADPFRILGGDGGDRGHGMAAEHGDRLDIGLDAGAAAAVGPGDDEDARDHRRLLHRASRAKFMMRRIQSP